MCTSKKENRRTLFWGPPVLVHFSCGGALVGEPQTDAGLPIKAVVLR
jgi:hypothetical protein